MQRHPHPEGRAATAGKATAVLAIGAFAGGTAYAAGAGTMPPWLAAAVSATPALIAASMIMHAGRTGRAGNATLERPEPAGGEQVATFSDAPAPSAGKAAATLAALGEAASVVVVEPKATPRSERDAGTRLQWLAAMLDDDARVRSDQRPVEADDPQWLASVKYLAVLLAYKVVRPGDGTLQGRGVYELADLVSPSVPELDSDTVVAFVGDFLLYRAGQSPTSGRDWHGVLQRQALDQRKAAVRRLADCLVQEIKFLDGSLAGRGIRALSKVIAGRLPELDAETVREFVTDYMEVRAGYRPKSGWRYTIDALSPYTRERLVLDMVGAAGTNGLTMRALAERIGWLCDADTDGPAWPIEPVVNKLTRVGDLVQEREQGRLSLAAWTDPRWQNKVRDLAAHLVEAIRADDGDLAGPRVSELVTAMVDRVPGLHPVTVRAFVGDYLDVRAGQSPTSGWPWDRALDNLPEETVAAMVVDFVAAAGDKGISSGAILQRLDRMDVPLPEWPDMLLNGLVLEGVLTVTDYLYRYLGQRAGVDGIR